MREKSHAYCFYNGPYGTYGCLRHLMTFCKGLKHQFTIWETQKARNSETKNDLDKEKRSESFKHFLNRIYKKERRIRPRIKRTHQRLKKKGANNNFFLKKKQRFRNKQAKNLKGKKEMGQKKKEMGPKN